MLTKTTGNLKKDFGKLAQNELITNKLIRSLRAKVGWLSRRLEFERELGNRLYLLMVDNPQTKRMADAAITQLYNEQKWKDRQKRIKQ